MILNKLPLVLPALPASKTSGALWLISPAVELTDGELTPLDEAAVAVTTHSPGALIFKLSPRMKGLSVAESGSIGYCLAVKFLAIKIAYMGELSAESNCKSVLVRISSL